MPSPHGKTKMTGDVHLPDVESDLPLQEGTGDDIGAESTPTGRGSAGESSDEARPGRGINQAGLLKDRDAKTSDSYGNTRDSGERPR